MKEVENVEKKYSELNVGAYSYPVVTIGNELFLKFDVNDGEQIYYSWMHETDDGILIDMMLDIVVWHECKSHANLNYGDRPDGAYWGYKNGKLSYMNSDNIEHVNTPTFLHGDELTSPKSGDYIQDETIQCVYCGADKVVYGKKGGFAAIAFDEVTFGCPHWHM